MQSGAGRAAGILQPDDRAHVKLRGPWEAGQLSPALDLFFVHGFVELVRSD